MIRDPADRLDNAFSRQACLMLRVGGWPGAAVAKYQVPKVTKTIRPQRIQKWYFLSTSSEADFFHDDRLLRESGFNSQ